MSSSLRRRPRKIVASVVLGAWLFGLFVAIAQACDVGNAMTMRTDPVGGGTGGEPPASDMAPGCAKFCNDDLPLLTKIQPVQDPPDGQPIVLASPRDLGFVPIPASDLRPALAAHPPPAAPPLLRFLRLSL